MDGRVARLSYQRVAWTECTCSCAPSCTYFCSPDAAAGLASGSPPRWPCGFSRQTSIWPCTSTTACISLMDLGRLGHLARSGMWGTIRRKGWSPVAGAESIAFRKSLKLGQRYSIGTHVVGVDDKAIYFEHPMVADGEIYARAHVATRLVGKHRPVSNEEIFAMAGPPPADLVLPDWIRQWREGNALPGSRRPAPHSWV